MHRANVQVVGAGPAGSSAAISAILHSASVTIIEKSRFPRHKVCGEFLSPEICGILDQLHCSDRFFALSPTLIRRMLLHFGSREKNCVLPEVAYGLTRYALDQLLLEKAVELGAVCVRETWSETESQDATVMSVGRTSVAPAGNRLFGFKAHFSGPTDDAVELFFFDDSYVGVSAVEGGATNVCGLAPEHILRQYNFNPDEFVSKFPPLAARLLPLSRKMPWLRVGPLVLSHRLKDPASENIYHAGDALGFTDPFTGSGILTAMLTGAMAGRAAAEGSPASLYLKECRRALMRSRYISAIFRAVLKTGYGPLLAAPIPSRWLFEWTRPVFRTVSRKSE